MSSQRNDSDPLVWRGTKAEALRELETLEPAARRMGYGLEVRGTVRRRGNSLCEERPYGVYLTKGPEGAQGSPGHSSGVESVRGGSKGRRRPLRAV